MLKLYTRIQDAIKNVHNKQEAQDGFEYLMVVAVVSVAVVGAIVFAPGVITDITQATADKVIATIG